MPYLKSNISNNMIKYSIESDYIDFSIEVLENENDFFKLIKFFLTKLKQDNCSLPIKFYTNDYLKNEDLDFLLEETNKENFRFCLTISQNNILKFFKQNLLKVLKNNYDVHLYHSNNNYYSDGWYHLTSTDENDKLCFNVDLHPYGILFNLIQINNPDEVLILIENMLKLLKSRNILKPIKIRIKSPMLLENMIPIKYSINQKYLDEDFLIKQDDFVNFFKKNIVFFVDNSKINLNIKIDKEVADNDGWTMAVNTRKKKSQAHGKAKFLLYSKLAELSNSVN